MSFQTITAASISFQTAVRSGLDHDRRARVCALHVQLAGPRACWIVCSGADAEGHDAPHVAAEAIADAFRRDPDVSRAAVHRYFMAAQSAVLRTQRTRAELRTTGVVLVADDAGAVWGHVGNARLYAFSGGRVVHQTRDHSVSQALAESGDIGDDEVRAHPLRHRLLRAIGRPGALYPTIARRRGLGPMDAFLLCTSDLWTRVSERALEEDLLATAHPARWLDSLDRRLGEGRPELDAIAILVREIP